MSHKPWTLAAALGAALFAVSPPAWACGDKILREGLLAGCPTKGYGRISLDYQYMHGGAHLFSRDVTGRALGATYVGVGRSGFVGDTFSHSTTLGFDYGILDRLHVEGTVVFAAASYKGLAPHRIVPGWAQMDDGKYHASFQDAAFGLRYTATKGAFTATPFARYGFPVRDYVPLGHSAIGRRLKAAELGIELGRSLAPVLPDAYVRATGSYSLVSGDADVFGVSPAEIQRLDLDRRRVMVEGGYAVTPRLTALAFWDYLHTERGLDFLEVNNANFRMHDAVLGARNHTVGGAVAFRVRGGTWVRAALSTVLAGQNTHDGSALAIGVTQSIGRCRRPALTP